MQDFAPATNTLVSRDTRWYGRAERQYAMYVGGSVNEALTLGMLAIRCKRKGDDVEPLTLSIPDRLEDEVC